MSRYRLSLSADPDDSDPDDSEPELELPELESELRDRLRELLDELEENPDPRFNLWKWRNLTFNFTELAVFEVDPDAFTLGFLPVHLGVYWKYFIYEMDHFTIIFLKTLFCL